jgi:mannose-6-phosphate isomerase-like protein (cupin superfamily)
MTTVTGRTLDDAGDPVPGTGFEYEEGGLIAELLAERVGPLNSHPSRPVWGAPLSRPDDTEAMRTVSIFGPGYEGPPEHYHEVSDETFDVRQGEMTYVCDGTTVPVTAGETVTVETGTRHTFRCTGDDLTVVVTTIEPLGRIGHVLPTLSGIAHDSAVDADDPLQRALIAKRLQDDTIFVEAESGLRRVATDLLAPLAKLQGYQGGYDRYRQPSFWERHVEQPS